MYLFKYASVHLSGIGQISVFIPGFLVFLVYTFVFAAPYQIDNVILEQKKRTVLPRRYYRVNRVQGIRQGFKYSTGEPIAKFQVAGESRKERGSTTIAWRALIADQ
jgi:hypothetical protein